MFSAVLSLVFMGIAIVVMPEGANWRQLTAMLCSGLSYHLWMLARPW